VFWERERNRREDVLWVAIFLSPTVGRETVEGGITHHFSSPWILSCRSRAWRNWESTPGQQGRRDAVRGRTGAWRWKRHYAERFGGCQEVWSCVPGSVHLSARSRSRSVCHHHSGTTNTGCLNPISTSQGFVSITIPQIGKRDVNLSFKKLQFRTLLKYKNCRISVIILH